LTPAAQTIPWYRSIRLRLVAAAVIVEAIMLTFLLTNSYRLVSEALESQTRIRLEALAPLLDASLAGRVFQRDHSEIAAIIKQLVGSKRTEISYIVVFDRRGEVLASVGEVTPQLLSNSAPEDRTVNASLTDMIYDTSVPLTVQGSPVGSARFGLSLVDLVTLRGNVLEQSVLIALGEILLSLLLLSVGGYLITRHISSLVAATRRIASADYSAPIVIANRDEIGLLADNFNAMAATVQSRIGQLAESESRFRSIFDAAGDAFFIHDAADGHLLDVNLRMCEMFGCTREQALQSSIANFSAGVTPYTKVEAAEKLRQVMDGPQTFDWLARRLDGHTFWVEVNLRRARIGTADRIVATVRDITERKQQEEKTRQLLAENETILRNALVGITHLRQRRIVSCNRRFEEIFQYEPGELIGESSERLYDTHENFLKIGERGYATLAEGRNHSEELLLRHKDGSLFWGALNGCAIDPAHPTDGSIWIYTDISERKQAEEKLHLAASVFTHAREGIIITDAEGTIIDVNDTFTRITGYGRDEVIGQNSRILNSGRHGKEFFAAMWHDLMESGNWHGEMWNRCKNGDYFASLQTISAVRDADGQARHYVSLFSDITALKEHQRHLEHIAQYDALTSLPNRVLLADRLKQAMAQTQRREQLLAVAYLDLDGFKAINDRHGHDAGDQLLIALATRMKQALRESDTLARLGGDEFVAVLIDLENESASVPMLNRLLDAASLPVHVGDLILQVSASIGVAFYPFEEVDADQLLRQADQAMYQAKLAGKNRYHVFDAAQDSSIRGHHESLERIRHALTQGEFVLHYQPKVNMRTGAVVGAEALIRWQCPERGLLPPAVFLPVIEDHPLAIEVGAWVINTALTQIALWQAQGLDIPVSVNVGAHQLQQADFVESLREILVAHPDVRPDYLEIEVLETSALEDLAHVSQVMDVCRMIGITFALDDFGTGYSSLTYLKRLPVSLLKIDQSFVRDMLDDPDDLSILDGVLGLAAAFNRQAIAEGVETLEHGAMLLQLGCELAQGYGIARPMPADSFPAWAATWRVDPSWCNLQAVSRTDLPILYASVEHRVWITAIEDLLKGQRETPPPLDVHQCRFGKWLDVESLTNPGTHPVFQAINQIHQQVHALAVELLELWSRGRAPEALARLDELHKLRDALLEQLKVLIRWKSP
jgi:diguanylate cyclase (GGDEF)-like protein/PAS domain S-box-containing protein